MFIINNIIVNDELFEEHFACNLDACKGACCWEGDYGAPLEPEEVEILENIQKILLEFIDERSIALLNKEGGIRFYQDKKIMGTNLHEDGACVYLNTEGPISYCGIERAWKEKKIDFRKPISCHLYPIRIEENYVSGFETLNYDVWDICSAACVKGKEEKIKVFEFAKEAIQRKYGEAFYEQLEAYVNQESE